MTMGKKENLPLILASASPRRQELLRSAGVPIKVFPSRADEEFRPGEKPEDYALRLAGEKAKEVSGKHPGRWVLGADTVVVVGGRVLGKPKDPGEAERMLRLLSGRRHRVVTGYCLVKRPGRKKKEGIVSTKVSFKELAPGEIRWYIATGEPFDKAGAYAIQGRGAFLVRRIEGSYTNVVGLPLGEVLEALREFGAVENHSPQRAQRPRRKSEDRKEKTRNRK